MVIGYLFISVVGMVVLNRCMINAPIGYEDEHGFHYGYPPVATIKN